MIKPIAVALILLTPSAYADVDLPAELKDKIEAVGINPVSAEKSPVSGIYSVFSKEGTSYVTSDGEYIFTGNLFKVKGTEWKTPRTSLSVKGCDPILRSSILSPTKHQMRNMSSVFLLISPVAFARNYIATCNPIWIKASLLNSSHTHVPG